VRSILVFVPAGADLSANWPRAIEAAGYRIVGIARGPALAGEALRCQPDLVLACVPVISREVFEAFSELQAALPLPIAVFTEDARPDSMQQALACGVQEWVVHGDPAHMLRSTLQMAVLRFRHGSEMRRALDDARTRLDERKWVDRAKGMLMETQHWTEERAFAALRGSAMRQQQRIGAFAQQLIEVVRGAEAMNHGGRLRMLSQRLVKLHGLRVLARTSEGDALIEQSMAQARLQQRLLRERLVSSAFEELLLGTEDAVDALEAVLATSPTPRSLLQADAVAETLLARAEALTRAVEAQAVPTLEPARELLNLVNHTGRQRMWCQRVAKQVIVSRVTGEDRREDAVLAARSFEQTLETLKLQAPGEEAVQQVLERAATLWRAFVEGAERCDSLPQVVQFSSLSETLLQVLDELTQRQASRLELLLVPALRGTTLS
jgi:AmiR/NasT family two-component response regulator